MAADLLAGTAWRCGRADPGSSVVDGWLPCDLPGTAAAAWTAAHGAAAAEAVDFDASDWWFVTDVEVDDGGAHVLALDGVATLAAVLVDGAEVAASSGMWTRTRVGLDLAPGPHRIEIVCRALRPVLEQKRPRPRWRTRLVGDQTLRFVRTSLLGRMPALSPTCAPVGPWRTVTLHRADALAVVDRDVVATLLDAARGRVEVGVVMSGVAEGAVATVRVGDVAVATHVVGGRLHADVDVVDPPLWWPHSHGPQPLVPVTVEVAGTTWSLADVGFRTIEADRSDGGFTLQVNGIPLFVRGAVWTPVDPVGLGARPDELRRQLLLVRDAGFTMVRVVGTATYESDEFWDECDRLGILVWQDCMLATLDPPSDVEWLGAFEAEVRGELSRLRRHPALAVVSGGSETEQQPTMVGLDADHRGIAAIEIVVPAVMAEVLPRTPYVTSSPSGGDLPTHNGTGVAHWFGVGGYRRPLHDVRRARVRFAAECLAFATPAERWSLQRSLPGATADPLWVQGIPADNGADWTFLDVTDHYVREIFDEDPAVAEEDRGLDLRRAAVAHAMAEVFSEWRSASSTCAGGLVLEWRDRRPGAGWGLIDVDGVPKATWHALRRVLQPVALVVTDEGLDGLRVHVVNETADALVATARVTILGRRGAQESGDVAIEVPARGAASFTVDGAIGAFRDVVHAYGFGDAGYSAVRVELLGTDGAEVASVVRLVSDQRLGDLPDPQLTHEVVESDGRLLVRVTAAGLAPWVVVEAAGHVASDSWFHLWPGETREVELVPIPGRTASRSSGDQPPAVDVRSLAPVS